MNKIKKSMKKIMIRIAVAAVFVLAIGVSHAADNTVLSVEAAGRPVKIDSCLISGGNVVCQLSASSIPSSDDGKYYIYADEVYMDGPTGSVVASTGAGTSVSVSFPLYCN